MQVNWLSRDAVPFLWVPKIPVSDEYKNVNITFNGEEWYILHDFSSCIKGLITHLSATMFIYFLLQG